MVPLHLAQQTGCVALAILVGVMTARGLFVKMIPGGVLLCFLMGSWCLSFTFLYALNMKILIHLFYQLLLRPSYDFHSMAGCLSLFQ